MKKLKFKDISALKEVELELNDDYIALILAIQDLTNQIRRLADK